MTILIDHFLLITVNQLRVDRGEPASPKYSAPIPEHPLNARACWSMCCLLVPSTVSPNLMYECRPGGGEDSSIGLAPDQCPFRNPSQSGGDAP